MFGKAAMIAVLLVPTASIARHDDHRTATDPVFWFNVAVSSARIERMKRARSRQYILPFPVCRTSADLLASAALSLSYFGAAATVSPSGKILYSKKDAFSPGPKGPGTAFLTGGKL